MNETSRFDDVLNALKSNVTLKDLFHPANYSSRERVVFGSTLAAGIILLQIFLLPLAADDPTRNRSSNTSRLFTAHPLGAIAQVDEILAALGKRELFAVTERPPPVAVVPRPEARGPGIQEMVKELTLLGVIEDTPMQAFIESNKTRETYTVQPGDRILEMEVMEITPGQVTLAYNQETTVLR